MSKASKTMGAIALSAALALGTAVPAFADPAPTDRPNETTSVRDEAATGTSSVVEGEEGEGQFTYAPASADEGAPKVNTGSTKVRVMSEVTQLSATVPVMVYVVADVMGGQLLGAPTGTGALTGVADADAGTVSYTGYRIENNTNRQIYVTDVKASTDDESGQWLYEDGDITSGYSDLKTAKRGRIHLTLNPYEMQSAYTAALTNGVSGTDTSKTYAGTLLDEAKAEAATTSTAKDKVSKAKGAVPVTTTGGATYDWAIPAFTYSKAEGHTTEFTPGVLGLEIRGTTSMIKDGTIIQYGSSADASAGAAAFDEDTYKPSGTDLGDVKLTYTIGATAKVAS